MICNVSKIDRIVRALSAIALLSVAVIFVPTVVPKVLILAISMLLLLSAWFGVCYIYRMIGFQTAKASEKAPQ